MVTSCPPDAVLECPATPTFGTPTFFEACDPNLLVTFVDTSLPGTCPTVKRTWTATDHCGNSVTCSQTVTVVDITPPVITGCTNISTNSLAGTNDNFVSYPLPNAVDNCDGLVDVTCVPPPDSFFLNGQTVVTCTSVDHCGNTNTCQFSVSILNPCVTLTNNLRPLFIELDGVERPGGIVLRWEDGGQLQTAASLENPVWVNVAGTSPLLVPAPLVPSGSPSDPSAGKRFFRTISADGLCSPSIVGYVNFTLTGGQQYLLGNPLNGTNNLLDTILPLPPSADGTSIYRFDPATQSFSEPILWLASFGWFTSGSSLDINPAKAFP